MDADLVLHVLDLRVFQELNVALQTVDRCRFDCYCLILLSLSFFGTLGVLIESTSMELLSIATLGDWRYLGD